MVVISSNSISHINIPSISHKITVLRGYIHIVITDEILQLYSPSPCMIDVHPGFIHYSPTGWWFLATPLKKKTLSVVMMKNVPNHQAKQPKQMIHIP